MFSHPKRFNFSLVSLSIFELDSLWLGTLHSLEFRSQLNLFHRRKRNYSMKMTITLDDLRNELGSSFLCQHVFAL